MVIVYARVSTRSQNCDQQIGVLKGSGIDRIFREKAKVKTVKGRTQLEKDIDVLGTDDVFFITAWDRASRSMVDGITIIQRLADRVATLKLLGKHWLDFITPMSKSILAFLSALAKVERERIKYLAKQGRTAAKDRSLNFGPRPKLTEHQRSMALAPFANLYSCCAIGKNTAVAHAKISRLR
ncbi:MAG: recombinase family protein [Pseudomonadota bacterium]